MSAPSIPGSVATHEDILHLEKRMDEHAALISEMQKAIARLDERLVAVTRMLNWIFMLQVAMTVGFMGSMVAFIALWFQINA